MPRCSERPVGEVKPLPDQNPHQTAKNAAQTLAALSTLPPPVIPDTLSDFAAEGAQDEFLRNGLSRMTLRKLRRGNWLVRDSLDLHGNTAMRRANCCRNFCMRPAAARAARVLVIHGKGMNSRGGEAVLRRLTRHWLAQRPDVLAYCDAAPKDGGSGAALCC